MNAFSVIAKLLTAIAVIAGAVFVVVVYGDKILAFIHKLLSRVGCPCNQCDDSDFVDDCDLEDEDFVSDDQNFEG